ncbi:hypothetical protein PPROV_001071300 [Pycnococcus provasolii]|uniref:SART-1 family protein n=1 Tax=Pycnococcus provasolii TaxID=41880 RepID=A0A830HX07_9CHLO|nr:hypothetical protein PPROV_001071300 [Pycnococcus provasolii]
MAPRGDGGGGGGGAAGAAAGGGAAAAAAGEISLSISASNALRASLGLKPLNVNGGGGGGGSSGVTLVDPSRSASLVDADPAALRARLLLAKQKREQAETLAATQTLGKTGDADVDDLGAFLSASRTKHTKTNMSAKARQAEKQRELLQEQDEEAERAAEKARQTAEEVTNLNVAHADLSTRLEGGEEVILTLADQSIIDNETGDVRDGDGADGVLENATWAAERRRKKLRALAHKPGDVDDDDDDAYAGVGAGLDERMRSSRILRQYEDVVDGDAVVRTDGAVKLGAIVTQGGGAPMQVDATLPPPVQENAEVGVSTVAPAIPKAMASEATRKRLALLKNKAPESIATVHAPTADVNGIAQPASDYMTMEEAAAAAGGGGDGKRRKKKKKKHLRQGDATEDAAAAADPMPKPTAAEQYDALEAVADAEKVGGTDNERRKRRRGADAAADAVAAAAAAASAEAESRSRYERALERAEARGAHLKNSQSDADMANGEPDKADGALANMLARARRAAIHSKGAGSHDNPLAAPPSERAVEAVAARVRAQAVKEDAGMSDVGHALKRDDGDSRLVFDEMEEFTRALPLMMDEAPALPSLQRATAAAELKEEREAAEVAVAMAAAEPRGEEEANGDDAEMEPAGVGAVAAHKPDPEEDQPAPRVAAGGLSSILSAARDSGFLKEKVMWSGRNNELKRGELKDIEEQWETMEEQARESMLLDRARSKGGGPSGSTLEALNRPDRFADVRVEYQDEFGFTQNPKEAFRQLCHQFHNIKPSKKQREKRIKKAEQEFARRSQAAGNSAGDLEEMRRATGGSALPLTSGASGHPATVVDNTAGARTAPSASAAPFKMTFNK